ncbi:hypothetical protein L1049_018587 [Liquidambar formosana]|uniref:Uncharacterized protein n=1 Tax=Liquidambar formosana TaxID=63359 RepID=A0AAP0RAA1_LIQFO
MQANSAVATWRHTKICNYDKLLDLFTKDKATGEGAISAREKVHQWAAKERPNPIDLNDEVSGYNFNFETMSPVGTPSTSSQVNFQCGTFSKDKKHKADLMVDVLERQIEVINYGIASVADVIKEGNIIEEKGIAIVEKGRPCCYPEDEVFSEIMNIRLLEHHQLGAFLFLIKSQLKVRAFFGVPSDCRLELLMKMMYESRDA